MVPGLLDDVIHLLEEIGSDSFARYTRSSVQETEDALVPTQGVGHRSRLQTATNVISCRCRSSKLVVLFYLLLLFISLLCFDAVDRLGIGGVS